MKFFNKEVQIALVAIAGIVVLFFGLQFLKGLSLYSNEDTYYVAFDDISGLSASSPVYAAGYKVGVVKDIIYNYNNPLRFRSDNFYPFKIFNQNIRAVFPSQPGGIQNHMIIVHISPNLSGILIIILRPVLIILFQHCPCVVIRKGFLFHNAFNTVFLIGDHIYVKHICLILQNFRSTAS